MYVPLLLALLMSQPSGLPQESGAPQESSPPQDSEDEHQEDVHGSRAPLPSAEVIAKLPADGGDEFNRLVFSKSPYLLQHARNPVDWHEWGPNAFKLAAERGVPVFLSIGYSTCHWCHVMEHESFEDLQVAALMNDAFVCVKVDREERPDIDQLYMTVTQRLSGSGGWPMTVVMTPEKKPFFAGTYFPKESFGQRRGMLDLVPILDDAWRTRREEVTTAADAIVKDLVAQAATAPGELLGVEVLALAEGQLAQSYDPVRGGFGESRKFPLAHNIRFLMRRYARTGDPKTLEMATKTLRAWRLGGIFDHVGLGMHRYSTDPEWLAPHFEKMLYDQALCAMAYVDAWLVTKEPEFERAAREILRYVERDMTSPGGGFYSAEDADSEGEEGLFYLWTRAELVEVLGEADAAFVAASFKVTDEGNYLDEATRRRNGKNILHLDGPLADAERSRWEGLRPKLWKSREGRIHPLKDDKILTDWNGLMISAFARAGRAFGDEGLVSRAREAADFVRANLRTPKGRLFKRSRGGEAGLDGMLEDYAYMADGLLDLFEASHEPRDLAFAKECIEGALAHFWDEGNGGFYLSPDDGEALIVRAKQVYDGARPSGNSVLASAMVRAARLTGNMDYEARAISVIKAFSVEVARYPSSHTHLLGVVDRMAPSAKEGEGDAGAAREIVVVGSESSKETQLILRFLATRYAPNDVVLVRPPGAPDSPAVAPLAALAPYAAAHHQVDGKTTIYVCSNFACKAPVTTLEELKALLE